MSNRHNPLEEAMKEEKENDNTIIIILPESSSIDGRVVKIPTKDALQLVANIAIQAALSNG